jgi:hypothetical protein
MLSVICIVGEHIHQQTSEGTGWAQTWDWEDKRVMQAARRIIRLYNLEEMTFLTVKPESLARLFAQELNTKDTSFKKRPAAQPASSSQDEPAVTRKGRP